VGSRVAATSSYTVEFRRPRPTPVAAQQPTGRIPRVARLLALAHRIDGMIRSGELRDLAHAARLCGLTRARVTQVCNLLLLCPEIQEAILDLPPVVEGRDPLTERHLRAIAAEAEWTAQAGLWTTMRAEGGLLPRASSLRGGGKCRGNIA